MTPFCKNKNINWYVIDLISNREISDSIEHQFEIKHESPQVLIIKNGQCVYHKSHLNIRFDEILDNLD